MDIYIVIYDPPGDGISRVVGAFSTRQKAQLAALELGDDCYDVVLVELDR